MRRELSTGIESVRGSTHVDASVVRDCVRMTLQQTGLAKVDENMLACLPLMTRRGDRQPDRIPGQNLNLSLGDAPPVSP